jgi:FG-GAP-like repeat
MRARLSWLSSVLLTLSAGAAHAQSPTFATTSYTAPAGARGAVGVDLNRNGWLDIVTANTGRNTIAIAINRGAAGGFETPREVAVGTGPFDIAAGDLNRDGIPDLVVATPDSNTIDVLLIGPNATVASRRSLQVGQSRGLTCADVTRDGILDLIYTDYLRGVMVVLRGDGTGQFPTKVGEFVVASRPQGVATGDFNHDGLLDAAVASTNGTVLNVLSGTSDGKFTRRTVEAGRTLNVLAVADFNADGWLDIAAASTSTNVVVFFRGDATGFTVAGTRPTGSSPRGIATADFNQDGRPDLAIGNRNSNSVSVFLARSDGSIVPDAWGDLPAAAGARAVVTGDFDHDGRADVAAGDELAPQTSVFMNTTTFVRPAFSFTNQEIVMHPGQIAMVGRDRGVRPARLLSGRERAEGDDTTRESARLHRRAVRRRSDPDLQVVGAAQRAEQFL